MTDEHLDSFVISKLPLDPQESMFGAKPARGTVSVVGSRTRKAQHNRSALKGNFGKIRYPECKPNEIELILCVSGKEFSVIDVYCLFRDQDSKRNEYHSTQWDAIC